MAKKHQSQHIIAFAVYKKFKLLGQPGRFFKIAFPDYADAEKWLDGYCKERSFLNKEDFMIEEMPAIIKAWQP